MSSTEAPVRAGIDEVLHALLHASFGMHPDRLGAAVAQLASKHTTARDVHLLLVDLDQEVLSELDGGGQELSVEWSPAGQAFREEQPVIERTPDGRRVWLPILDSAERVGVLGLLDGAEVELDDWLALTSLLGELIVSKERYGDAITRARRRKPMSLPAEMRWALLPPLTFSSPEVSVSGILRPSYGLAGDAFDYAIDDTTATVAVFDAMGHGMRASRLANIAVGSFRACRRRGAFPAESLAEMDRVIDEQFDGTPFVTAQVLTLDLPTGVATVHTAGHPPPVRLTPHGDPEVISVTPGLPLGLGPSTYEPAHVQLEEGDALLLVSDGIYEARSSSGEQYGWPRMVGLAQDRFDAGDRAPELLRRTMREVVVFQGSEQSEEEVVHSDDATMVLIRWRPVAVGQPAEPLGARVQEAST